MFVAIAGRKGSGKTTFAERLLERGFVRVSFADNLKRLVSQLYGWEIGRLYSPADKEALLSPPVQWDKETASELARKVGAEECSLWTGDAVFLTIRDALQYIGTDVLRKYRSDFHVEQFVSKYDSGVDQVCDDMRFPNEHEATKSLADSFHVYVVRPSNFDYSNHSSEVALRRNDFRYVLVNDSTREQFVKKSNALADVLLESDRAAREKGLSNLLHNGGGRNGKSSNFWQCVLAKVSRMAVKLRVPVRSNAYDCDSDAFYHVNEESSYWAGVLSAGGCVRGCGSRRGMSVELASTDRDLVSDFKAFAKSDGPISVSRPPVGGAKYATAIASDFVADDMKQWCVEPGGAKCNKVPDCIRGDESLLRHWLVGLIDGGGTVRTTEEGGLLIGVTASKDVCDFLMEWLKDCGPTVDPDENVEGMFGIRFRGWSSDELRQRIRRGIETEPARGGAVDRRIERQCVRNINHY